MRQTFIYVLLGLSTACSTVSTTEIRYDRELVQYVTVPAEGLPEAESVHETDGPSDATPPGSDDEVDIRVIPASTPRPATPDHGS